MTKDGAHQKHGGTRESWSWGNSSLFLILPTLQHLVSYAALALHLLPRYIRLIISRRYPGSLSRQALLEEKLDSANNNTHSISPRFDLVNPSSIGTCSLGSIQRSRACALNAQTQNAGQQKSDIVFLDKRLSTPRADPFSPAPVLLPYLLMNKNQCSESDTRGTVIITFPDPFVRPQS